MNRAQLREHRARQAADAQAEKARKDNGTFDKALRKSKGPGKRRRGKKK